MSVCLSVHLSVCLFVYLFISAQKLLLTLLFKTCLSNVKLQVLKESVSSSFQTVFVSARQKRGYWRTSRPTDWWMDTQTDGQTNGWTLSLIESWLMTEKGKKELKNARYIFKPIFYHFLANLRGSKISFAYLCICTAGHWRNWFKI